MDIPARNDSGFGDHWHHGIALPTIASWGLIGAWGPFPFMKDLCLFAQVAHLISCLDGAF